MSAALQPSCGCMVILLQHLQVVDVLVSFWRWREPVTSSPSSLPNWTSRWYRVRCQSLILEWGKKIIKWFYEWLIVKSTWSHVHVCKVRVWLICLAALPFLVLVGRIIFSFWFVFEREILFSDSDGEVPEVTLLPVPLILYSSLAGSYGNFSCCSLWSQLWELVAPWGWGL